MLPLCLIVACGSNEPSELSRELASSGFKPYEVQTIDSAFNVISQWEFDALVVDADGRSDAILHALPTLRDHLKAPIILLSSDRGERRQIEFLRSGATVVIVKPATAELIAAKLDRVLDVSQERPAIAMEERSGIVRVGPLSIDPRRAKALVGEVPLRLTNGELQLLLLLASQPGEFVHRDKITQTVRHGETRRSADMHVCRIRQKLRQAGASTLRIETAYGLGYRIKLAAPRDRSPDHRSLDTLDSTDPKIGMLQMRPNCECCNRDLAPEFAQARICSFECTFCEPCARDVLGGRCPNCGGELVTRPCRSAAALAKFPASTERIFKPGGCGATVQ